MLAFVLHKQSVGNLVRQLTMEMDSAVFY